MRGKLTQEGRLTNKKQTNEKKPQRKPTKNMQWLWYLLGGLLTSLWMSALCLWRVPRPFRSIYVSCNFGICRRSGQPLSLSRCISPTPVGACNCRITGVIPWQITTKTFGPVFLSTKAPSEDNPKEPYIPPPHQQTLWCGWLLCFSCSVSTKAA